MSTSDATKIPPRVADMKGTNADAARLYLVYRDLRGEPAKPEDVPPLVRSDSERDKAFVKVLTSPKIDPALLAKLEKDLGTGEAARYTIQRAREKAGESANWAAYQSRALFAGLGVGGALFLCAIGCILIVVYWTGRNRGAYKPLGHPAWPITQFESDVYAGRVVLILLTIFFAPFFLRPLLSGIPGGNIVSALFVILFVLALSKWKLGGVRIDRWTRTNSPKGLKAVGIGFLIYLMGLPLIVTATILGTQLFSFLPEPEHPATKAIPNASAVQLLAIFVMAAIQAPIVEEIAFRGTLLPAMRRLVNGPIAAVILTNLIFAAIHPTGIPAWPALAMIGVVASFAVYQTGSIVPAMAIHAFHNGALVIFSSLITR